MNSFANVVYAYAPKNDDELELKVGDKIEVIGFEEEGKCRCRLCSRVHSAYRNYNYLGHVKDQFTFVDRLMVTNFYTKHH